MMENDGEIWKDIVGYEGRYQVSNYGKVKSLGTLLIKKNGQKEFRKGVILRPQLNSAGYYMYSLNKKGVCKRMFAHRVVAEAFIINIEPKTRKYIDHINTIRTDNRVSNLRWVTAKENSNNPLTKGKISKTKTGRKLSTVQIAAMSMCRKGRRPSKKCLEAGLKASRIPIVQLDANGLFISEYESQLDASRKTGFNSTSINKALKGKIKLYKKSKWVYKNEYNK